ncbi:MAG: DUF1934 domain-containing protein [Oscillospiraceae bacterium]|nr:DUF1934 domain-containing protein [Oscillospiraceae bacterium]
MIEKNVILFVRGEQQFDQGEPEVTELMTEGAMTLEEDGEITLTYQETELTGMEGTTTRFSIRDDTVVLARTGMVNSQLVFQRGKRNSSLYETPWGMMQVDVFTTSLAHRLDGRGGILEIKFNISVDHQVAGENQFKIRVRESGR